MALGILGNKGGLTVNSKGVKITGAIWGALFFPTGPSSGLVGRLVFQLGKWCMGRQEPKLFTRITPVSKSKLRVWTPSNWTPRSQAVWPLTGEVNLFLPIILEYHYLEQIPDRKSGGKTAVYNEYSFWVYFLNFASLSQELIKLKVLVLGIWEIQWLADGTRST